MQDPEAIKKALEKTLKKKRIPVIPIFIGAVIAINILGAVLESANWEVAVPIVVFVLFWVAAIIIPKLKRGMKDVLAEVESATKNEAAARSGQKRSIPHAAHTGQHRKHAKPKPLAPQKKHCKSCDIMHSPETRYCRRCGAPLLR